MKAPKLSFKCPSLWLSINLSAMICACQIIHSSLLDPRVPDLLFWAHGELGLWPAEENNPGRQPSGQTPSGCASLDIDISLTLSFPLQHELLITWIPSGISCVMKEWRFCLNTLSRTDCFLWMKLLMCVCVPVSAGHRCLSVCLSMVPLFYNHLWIKLLFCHEQWLIQESLEELGKNCVHPEDYWRWGSNPINSWKNSALVFPWQL